MNTNQPPEDEKWVLRMHPDTSITDSLFENIRKVYESNPSVMTQPDYSSILRGPDVSVLKDNIQLLSRIEDATTYAPSHFSMRSYSVGSELSAMTEELLVDSTLPMRPSMISLLGSATVSGLISSCVSHPNDPRSRWYRACHGISTSLLLANSHILLSAFGGVVLRDLVSFGVAGLIESSQLTDLERRGCLTAVQKNVMLRNSLCGSLGSLAAYRLSSFAFGDSLDVKRLVVCFGISFVGSYVGRRIAAGVAVR